MLTWLTTHRYRITIIAIAALAIVVRLVPGEHMIDDSYITFRYARNIAAGNGFVYNLNERVLGTTTPLYTLLMAGLSFALRSESYPAIALWVNALADGLSCSLLVLLGQLATGRQRVGIATGLLYSIAPFSVTFAIGGMETSVCILMLVLTALLYLRQNNFWALAAALAVLTRPDTLIFIGPLGLDYAIRWLASVRTATATRATALKTSAYFLLPLIAWAVFATFYFGSPIPHSITAKTAAYKLEATEGVIRLVQHYTTPFFEQLSLPPEALIGFLFLYLTLSLMGLLLVYRYQTRSLSIGLYPYLYFITFAVANPLIFRWYLTPPLPFYFLLILGGLSQLADGVQVLAKRAVKSGINWSQIIFILPCIAWGVMTLRAWVLLPDHGPQRPTPDMAWFKLEEIYTQVGNELALKVTPSTVIAAGDIGALGYFSRATILDTLGLVSPQSTAYYPLPADEVIINYAISADLISDQQPDYVVFLEVYGRKTLLVDARFLESYTLYKKIPTDTYGSDGMLIYQRQSP